MKPFRICIVLENPRQIKKKSFTEPGRLPSPDLVPCRERRLFRRCSPVPCQTSQCSMWTGRWGRCEGTVKPLCWGSEYWASPVFKWLNSV